MASLVIAQLLSDLPAGWAECLPSSSFCARPRAVGRGFHAAAAAPPAHEADGPSALPSHLAVAACAVLSILLVAGLALSRRRLAASELDELEASTTPGAAPYIGSGKKTKKTKRRTDTTPRSKDVKSTPRSTPQTPSSHAAEAVKQDATITRKLFVPPTPAGESLCAKEGAREVSGRVKAARQVDATAAPALTAAPTPPLAVPVDAPAVAERIPMPRKTLAQHNEHATDAAQPEPPVATGGPPPQGAEPAGAGSSAPGEAALDVAGPPVPAAQPATRASPVAAPNASQTFVDGAILSSRLAASSEPAPAAASTDFRLEESSFTNSEPAASASKAGTSRDAFSSMSSEGSGECSPAPSSPSQETPETTPTLQLRAERSNLPWQVGVTPAGEVNPTSSVTGAPPEADEEATKETGAQKDEAPPLPGLLQTLALRRQGSSGRKSFKMLNTNLSIVTPVATESSPVAMRIIPLAPLAPSAVSLKPHRPSQPAGPAGPPAKPAEEMTESYRSSVNSCDNSGESTDYSCECNGSRHGSPYGDQANPAAAAFAAVPCVPPPVPRVLCDDAAPSAPSTPMPPLEPCTPTPRSSEHDAYSSPSSSRPARVRSPFSALQSPVSRSSAGIPASHRPPSSPTPPGLTPKATTPVSRSPPPGLSPGRSLSQRAPPSATLAEPPEPAGKEDKARAHVEFKFAPETYVPSQTATPKAAYGWRAAPRAELGVPSSPWLGNRRRSPRPSPGPRTPGERAPWSMPGAYGEFAPEMRRSDSRGSTPSTPRHLTLPKKKKNRAAQAARLRQELQQLVDPASPSDKRSRSIRRQTL